MLAGDSRSAWPAGMFDDPRVTSFWDRDQVAARWFAEHRTGGLGSPTIDIVWDAYLGYGPDARWRGAPTRPVVAGSEIISHTQGLSDAFVPLLGSS